MDLHSDHPFWLIKDGALADYAPLQEDTSCEIAILGGGVTGALLADELTRQGVGVIVLDKRHVGQGSTCASTCLLQYEIDTPLHVLQHLIGQHAASRTYLLGLEALEQIAELCAELDGGCGFERKTSLYVASEPKHVKLLELEHQARRSIGIDVDLWSTAEIASRFPFAAPAALYSHRAAQVDGYLFTHKLLARAVARGARVYDHTEAVSIEPNSSSVNLITQHGQRVTAGRIVFATGYETQCYVEQRITNLHSTYAVASEPMESMDGWFERCLIWESARPYFYARTTPEGRVLIGGADVPFRDPAARDELLASKTNSLLSRFGELFPTLAFKPACAWAGTFGETDDGLPYIGVRREFPLAFFALGYGGNGITFSAIAARIISQLYLGVKNADAAIFRFDR